MPGMMRITVLFFLTFWGTVSANTCGAYPDDNREYKEGKQSNTPCTPVAAGNCNDECFFVPDKCQQVFPTARTHKYKDGKRPEDTCNGRVDCNTNCIEQISFPATCATALSLSTAVAKAGVATTTECADVADCDTKCFTARTCAAPAEEKQYADQKSSTSECGTETQCANTCFVDRAKCGAVRTNTKVFKSDKKADDECEAAKCEEDCFEARKKCGAVPDAKQFKSDKKADDECEADKCEDACFEARKKCGAARTNAKVFKTDKKADDECEAAKCENDCFEARTKCGAVPDKKQFKTDKKADSKCDAAKCEDDCFEATKATTKAATTTQLSAATTFTTAKYYVAFLLAFYYY